MKTSKEQQGERRGRATLNRLALFCSAWPQATGWELMASILIYLQVALSQCLCECVSLVIPISLLCSIVSASLLSFLFPLCAYLFPFPSMHPFSSTLLLLTASVLPLCAIFFFWSSLMVFHQNAFQSVGSNSCYDCVWLCCFRRDTSRHKTGAASRCCHPQVLSVLNLLLFLLRPLPPSISLFLIRWEEHTLPLAALIVVICRCDWV